MKDTFTVRDEDFERVTRESFARQAFMTTLGAEIVHVDAAEAIDSFVTGMTSRDLESDRRTRDAVVRNLEITGRQ